MPSRYPHPSAHQMGILRSAALLLVASLVLPLSALAVPGPAELGRQVYRLSVEVGDLDELRNAVDLWAFYPGESMAIVFVDGDELRWLRARGWTPILDEERNEQVERARRNSEMERPTAEPGAGQTLVGGGIPGFPCYRTVEETYADLAAAASSHPTLASWVDIGDSWEKTVDQGGYDHQVLILTNQALAGPKPVFLLMAAMHAREYATAEIATRYALHLLQGYGTDPEATWLLDHREIHIVAQQNPDGRKQAESGLSWRKNTDNDFCTGSNSRGVDLNRNSTFFWGGPASSGSECNALYRGPSAASEPETENIEAYMAQVFLDQKGDMADPAPDDAEGVFISIHSFGELVLFPWEGTNSDGPNHAGLQTLGRRFGFLNEYTVCQDCLGTASGTTVDAAYGEYGVAAYTFEVGNSFFEGCAAFESQIYPDNLQALIYAAKVADLPYMRPGGPVAFDLTVSPMTVAAGQVVTVQATLDDSRFDSNGNGNEPTQAISSASLGLDLSTLEGGGGVAMLALDGAFDESQEGVSGSLDTTGLAPGKHLVHVLGEDQAGSQGTPGAVFLEVLLGDTIFDDGFESGGVLEWSDSSSD